MAIVKVFVPSWRRAGSTPTLALLEASGVRATVIVRKPEYAAYKAAVAGRHDLLVVGPNDGLNAAREAARKTLRTGEWVLHMDDNCLGFIAPKPAFYRKNEEVRLSPGETMITRAKWQPTMNVRMDFKAWYDLVVEDTIREATRCKANLAGFSAHENPAFRSKKYSEVGYVCGKAMLMRNVGLPWIQSTESSGEDYALTAAHLYDDGRVLINRWGHPLRKHYMAGGCGPYEERLPAMLRAQTELVTRYGALFGIKNAGKADKRQGELRVRFNTTEQVAAWKVALVAAGKDPNYRASPLGRVLRPKIGGSK